MKPLSEHCVLSIDVEDWFHILETSAAPSLAEWRTLPSRVERNFHHLLDLADEYQVRCTCFFVGWIADRYPDLVRAAVRAGHEVAAHGWAHQLATRMSPEEFYHDSLQARLVLEDISGSRVIGYRAAGFSLTPGNPWVFDELLRAGYLYDASLFPAVHAHGGWPNAPREPFEVHRKAGTLTEFPMTVENFLGRPVCFFGGGYLRLFSLPLVERMARRVLSQGRPVIFYVHPREIDHRPPRLMMSRWRTLKTYINVATTEAKLRHLMQSFRFSPLIDRLSPAPAASPAAIPPRSPLALLPTPRGPGAIGRLPLRPEGAL